MNRRGRAELRARGESLEAAAKEVVAPGLEIRSLAEVMEGAGPSPGSLGGVLSIGELGAISNDELSAVLARVRTSLAPGARFWFVDPAGHALGLPGMHSRRSLSEGIRHAGFLITDIERFAMPTRNPLLRSWIQGVAVVGSRTTGSSS